MDLTVLLNYGQSFWLLLSPKCVLNSPKTSFSYPLDTFHQRTKYLLRVFTLLSVWLATLGRHVGLTSQYYPMVLRVQNSPQTFHQRENYLLRMFTLLSVWIATLGSHVELTSQSYPMVLGVENSPQTPFLYPLETFHQRTKYLLRVFTLLSVWLATLGMGCGEMCVSCHICR